MAILQFTPTQHPIVGGLYHISQHFCQAIDRVSVVEIVNSEFKGKTEGDYQVHTFDSGIFKFYPLPTNHHRVLSNLSKLSVNLVIIQGFFRAHATIGYYFAKKHNIPYLWVPNGGLDPYVFTYRAWSKYLWLQTIGNKIIRDAAAVICSTSREAEKAQKYLHGVNVEICPWGINPPDLSEITQWRNEVRSRLGISSEQRVLIFLGRIHQMKRPVETALAFKQLQAKDWTLLMVGPVDEGGGAETIYHLCDGKYIQYHPPVHGLDKWKFLAASDAFINLSHRENFGFTVVEAAAVGLPLFISDGVDIFPVLKEAGAADVVTVRSQDDVYRSLDLFLHKLPSEHKQMGQKAQQCFQDNFTTQLFTSQINSIVNTYIKN